MNAPATGPGRWRRLARHPLFPLLVYLGLTQILRENYPFSHYPMYSRPNSGSLRMQFLADGEGKPLPVAWHTGITPSKVAKLHANRMRKLHDDRSAALEVLRFLREANAERPRRPLPARIRLMETELSVPGGRVVETHRVLAEDNPALKP